MIMQTPPRFLTPTGIARVARAPESTTRRKLAGVTPDAVISIPIGTRSREVPLYSADRIDELTGIVAGPLTAHTT